MFELGWRSKIENRCVRYYYLVNDEVGTVQYEMPIDMADLEPVDLDPETIYDAQFMEKTKHVTGDGGDADEEMSARPSEAAAGSAD